jgi:hypothetical protein
MTYVIKESYFTNHYTMKAYVTHWDLVCHNTTYVTNKSYVTNHYAMKAYVIH